MPNFFQELFDRIFQRDRNDAPRANGPEATGPGRTQRDGLRGMNYEEGRDALRPERPQVPQVEQTPQEPVAEPKQDEQKIELPKGQKYVLKGADVKYSADATWQHIAEQNGAIDWRLKQANEGVAPVEGAEIYIPSPEEMLYADCVKATGNHEKAAEKYARIADDGGLAVVKGAREAASGASGESYGTAGKGGAFYASNPALAGASSRRMVDHAGKKVYKVVWASNFWKCNLFANESVYRGGFEPSLAANKHYTTAGKLHKDTKTFEKVDAAAAYPGLVTVFQSGGGSNESHTGVLGSVPIITTDAAGNMVMKFTFIAASSDRAKEQDKVITLKKGTNEILSGDHHERLRFLKPKRKRAE